MRLVALLLQNQNPMALQLTVYSDYICPYCYVTLGTLLQLEKSFELDITWKGMEIHPDTPEEGMKLTDLFKEPDFPKTLQALAAKAKAVGLPFGDLSWLPNSNYAHQAAEFARRQGKFTEFHELLMKAYFGDLQNIGEIPVLQELGLKVGLDAAKLEEALVTEAFEPYLMETLQEARQWGISGTPTLIINDQYKVVGAQSQEHLEQLFEELSD